MPRRDDIETVLIVGSGPAGSSAALFLSELGGPNIMITKYRWTANTPRAHITNQRTMEIFRQCGVDQPPREHQRPLADRRDADRRDDEDDAARPVASRPAG